MPDCMLRDVNGRPGVECQGEECVYWRPVEQLDLGSPPPLQECAIQHFRLLDGGAQVAAWLLSVKERMEADRSPHEGS